MPPYNSRVPVGDPSQMLTPFAVNAATPETVALMAVLLLAEPAGELAAANLAVTRRGVNAPSKADVAVGVAVAQLRKRAGGCVGVAPRQSQSRTQFLGIGR